MPKKNLNKVWNYTAFSVANYYKVFRHGKLRPTKGSYVTEVKHLPDGRRYWAEDGVVLRWQVEDKKVVSLSVELDMGWVGPNSANGLKKMLKKFSKSPALVGTTFPAEFAQITSKL